jgi:hypothetical protein
MNAEVQALAARVQETREARPPWKKIGIAGAALAGFAMLASMSAVVCRTVTASASCCRIPAAASAP